MWATYRRSPEEESALRCLSFSCATGAFSFIYLAIAIGFLAALIAALANYNRTASCEPDVTVNCSADWVADNTTCALSSDCLQGFVSGADNDTCDYYPRPTDVVNCSSPCYSAPGGATQCDGAGSCVGDRTACVGTCAVNNDCDLVEKFQLNEALVYNVLYPTNWPATSWYEPHGCFGGQCVGLVMEIAVGSTVEPIDDDPEGVTYNFTALAVNNECEDYFLPAFVAEYRGCLVTQRSFLASSMVNYSRFFSGDLGNSSLPFQLSVCTVRFACGESDEPAPEEKRALADVRSAAQWGFTPAKPAAPEFLGPHTSPHLRHLFWARTREVVERALDPFIARAMELAKV